MILLMIKIVCLFFAIVLHEIAHGYVAYRLGDPTAKQAHRLTLNPLAHIDPIGSVILPLFLMLVRSPVLFGWAKPVPFNPGYFRDPYRGIMLVGAAGPAMNFILALLSAGLLRMIGPMPEILLNFLAFMCVTNVILGVFNLIPIPPLDGSRVVIGFLPRDLVPGYLALERFGFIVIFVLLWLGALDRVIYPVAGFLIRTLMGGH